MKVEFRKRKLKRCFEHKKLAAKEFDDQVARKYIQRIEIIKSVANLDDLMGLPGLRCHQLKGKRQGQYAVNLTGFYRLIFTVRDGCLNVVMIEEVSKHYDD